jgi:hypothetical protein
MLRKSSIGAGETCIMPLGLASAKIPKLLSGTRSTRVDLAYRLHGNLE